MTRTYVPQDFWKWLQTQLPRITQEWVEEYGADEIMTKLQQRWESQVRSED